MRLNYRGFRTKTVLVKPKNKQDKESVVRLLFVLFFTVTACSVTYLPIPLHQPGGQARLLPASI